MVLLFILASCRFEIPEQSRVCEDIATAIAHRVYVCTQDEDRANTLWHKVTDESDCLAASLDEQVYAATIEQSYGCVAALTALDCPAVAELGEDVGGWLSVHPSCAQVMVPLGGLSQDSGASL